MATASRRHGPVVHLPAITLSVLLVVAGCATPADAPVDPRATPDELALGGERSPGGDGASLTGTLTPEPGCVYLATPDSTVLPVFPHDVVSWDGTTLRLDGKEYRAGARVAVGGGYRDPAIFNINDIAQHVPEACRTDTVFGVS